MSIATSARAGVQAVFGSNLGRRQTRAMIWQVVFGAATLFAVLALAVLLVTVIRDGAGWLSWDLFTQSNSRRAENAGFQSGIIGTIWVISLTALVAIPVGIGAAIYLEEYGPRNWWTKILQTNISNLAGVPSVVYGLLGLGLFVYILGFGRSVLAAALTMALLILPIVIIASQESIRAVPPSLREAAYALGATKWQVTRSHVLPAALPGILTGTILALSRAIGETAPVVVVGAALFLSHNPDSVFSRFTVLPVQIYQWTARPQEDFRDLAAAGIIILLVMLLLMNSVAIFFRQRFSRNRW
ncbi:MAG: phosphate transporter, inner rane subunit PstA [Thermomicrobiales bacterium]|jgi:phosphate transport system permease protein|nr:phosphate transporter, inner rane subunit PstA [Thermomicrobiales bacterium]